MRVEYSHFIDIPDGMIPRLLELSTATDWRDEISYGTGMVLPYPVVVQIMKEVRDNKKGLSLNARPRKHTGNRY